MPADNQQADPGQLRNLPSIDALVRDEQVLETCGSDGSEYLIELARQHVAELREEILAGRDHVPDAPSVELHAEAVRRIIASAQRRSQRATRRVINATGVVLHTNLGRAPMSEAARAAVVANAFGYCTVEYDPSTGERSARGRFAEELLAGLTGAEAALVVNNCAAATILVLSELASGGEAIISRGELVEIGGDFRVPDVLVQSGAKLREVGTTNRTKLTDYETAITADTRLILRVHPSNYRIVGFTAGVNNRELSELAHKHDLLLFEDAGSGALVDLSSIGFTGEPVIATSIRDGADVVAFSGDKLLGGPQSGLIVGKRELIARMRRHPLYRAFRVSKLIYSALEATLLSYSRGAAMEEIPALNMLAATYEELHARSIALVQQCGGDKLRLEVIDGESVAGGGCLPAQSIRSPLIAVEHVDLSAERLESKFRENEPPIITRIEQGRVIIDLRAVGRDDEAELTTALIRCATQNPS